MAADFAHVQGAELVAVGSRSPERARAFADQFGIPQAGDYDDFFAADLDAIYLATPHAQHTELALAAIAAGKPCTGREVVHHFRGRFGGHCRGGPARDRGVFVMEAMWTRFLPALQRLRSGWSRAALGEVRTIQGDLIAPP